MDFWSYPKIETLYTRDPMTHRVTSEIRVPEFTIPQTWHVTEKIDGTNVRIMLKHTPEGGSVVTYGGRTNAASLQVSLITWLLEHLPADRVRAAFDLDTTAMIFGEGYGERIQAGGGDYRPGVAVRIFDVVVFGAEDAERHHHPKAWWLNWAAIEDVAKKLGVETVPVLGRALTLEQAAGLVRDAKEAAPSAVSIMETTRTVRPMEGIVARTEPILFTRTGGRLAFKLKHKDYQGGQ